MAVVDSCILIHLSRIGRLSLLEGLRVVVTPEVYREVVVESGGRAGTAELEEAFEKWIQTAKVKSSDSRKIAGLGGIEETDASLLLLARERREILVTNDKNLIRLARSMSVECWWPATLILNRLKAKKISPKEAEDILYELVNTGLRMHAGVYAAIVTQIRLMK
ncbi:MAG: type II toxin-antitoxin system VapC family toxin [Candidatus Altiarchaeota archaeon]